jgi:hypothetical protein
MGVFRTMASNVLKLPLRHLLVLHPFGGNTGNAVGAWACPAHIRTHRSHGRGKPTPLLRSPKWKENLCVLHQFPTGKNQHCCENGAHEAVGDQFAQLAAQEDAGERADQ